MKLFFSSDVANGLLSPTVQHFGNFALQYQFPLQNELVVNQHPTNDESVRPVINQPMIKSVGCEPASSEPAKG